MAAPRAHSLAALLGLLLWLAASGAAGAAAPPNPPAPGPYLPAISYQTWQDPSRAGREVPVKLYRPMGAPGPWPVVLISHGLGDSRDTLGYLARYLCSHGYYLAAMQHQGSDMSLGEGTNRLVAAWRLWRASRQPRNYLLRAQDLAFVLAELSQRDRRPGPWRHHLDLARVAVMGHSMGALTALYAAGQVFSGAAEPRSLRHPALRAFIALSPPVPPDQEDHARAYAGMDLPGLYITGGEDEAFIGSTQAHERRLPFEHSLRRDQYLLWLHQADHRTPLGYPAGGDRPPCEALYHQLIRMACQGFLDAYLRKDAAALAWLRGPAMARAVNGEGSWEARPGSEEQK